MVYEVTHPPELGVQWVQILPLRLFLNPKMSFANIFGAPRTGVHAYRLFDVAIVDFGLTVAAAYPLSRYLGQPFLSTAVLLVLVSVPVHMAFGVQTKLASLI